MKAVSEVIAIILILMITISLAGLAYMFMSTTMSDVTSSASSTVDTTTSSMMTSFTIESVDIAKVYLRNTGQNALTGLTVYVNDEMATINVTPSSIAAGAVGTITIYSFIPDGAKIKVTSPSGFSTSKVAQPCNKAVGCWKFDEGTGITAYDSSTYGNKGTLTNGPVWTSGKYGSALRFDGVNDYFYAGASSSINSLTSTMTACFWMYSMDNRGGHVLDSIGFTAGDGGWFIRRNGGSPHTLTFEYWASGASSATGAVGGGSITDNTWHYVCGVLNIPNNNIRIYVNGVSIASGPAGGQIGPYNDGFAASYADWAGPAQWFNGTIDEVRIYNRAIY